MTSQPLYNLSPLAQLLLVGGLIALVPLLWVAFRHRGQDARGRLHALALVTLFLTFDLVLFGAFTRLSDSGLGCPDWPGCYGHASPVGAKAHIATAQAALPTGPVTHGKAWIEMIHRYLASSVGALILVQAAAAWWLHVKGQANRAASKRVSLTTPALPTISPWWPTLTLLWVCVQGAFGALTVTMKLFPVIVTLHLLGGLLLLAMLVVQAVRGAAPAVRAEAISPGLRGLLWISLAALWVQIALGGWVSTNYAVLACSDFPTCQGSAWPPMNFTQGFELWRALGLTGSGQPIDFAALTAIHYVHRIGAVVVVILLAGLALRLNQNAAWRPGARWIAGLVGLQVATGLSNVVLDWPMPAAVLHTGGAAALVMVLTWTVCKLPARALAARQPQSPAFTRLNA